MLIVFNVGGVVKSGIAIKLIFYLNANFITRRDT